ncbi:ArsR family transcriptional regulator [Streptomyces sp. NPDC053755]|uniref:ArsR family transcriptional regulator n=1 Tax=Streptomyces sp. NPDC053755 TaxID=3155815 RepID=UPI00342DE806
MAVEIRFTAASVARVRLTTPALAARLGVTPSAVSQHLGALRGAGLVSTQRQGRNALHLLTERATRLLEGPSP